MNPAFVPPADVLVVYSVQESIEAGLDLAVICNPTSWHATTARQFLEAGVPVLIEKPLAAHMGEATQLVDLAEQTGVPAGVAYCLRYHPAYALTHEYVQQGKLGSIERVAAWFESYLPEWHPWEDYRQGYAARADLGGGVLPTLDHEIDFVCWCCGPPESCAGASSRSGLLDCDVDDTANLALSYPDYTAEIELSICRRHRRRGFEWVGDRAVLSFSFEQQLLRRTDRDGTASEIIWHRPEFDLNDMYAAMLGDALRAVAAKEPLPIPLRAGLDALRVAAAATHQAETRRQSRPRDLARGKPT